MSLAAQAKRFLSRGLTSGVERSSTAPGGAVTGLNIMQAYHDPRFLEDSIALFLDQHDGEEALRRLCDHFVFERRPPFESYDPKEHVDARDQNLHIRVFTDAQLALLPSALRVDVASRSLRPTLEATHRDAQNEMNAVEASPPPRGKRNGAKEVEA